MDYCCFLAPSTSTVFSRPRIMMISSGTTTGAGGGGGGGASFGFGADLGALLLATWTGFLLPPYNSPVS